MLVTMYDCHTMMGFVTGQQNGSFACVDTVTFGPITVIS
jgi:hypothetical protein